MGFRVVWPNLLVQVATSNPLSRPHPCCDINLMSRQRLKVSAAFELVFHVVTTPIYAFAGLRCSLMMSRHHDLVATSTLVSCTLPLVVVMSRPQFSCRDINLMNCCFEWVLSGVMTSTSCRDVNSWLRSFQLMSS